MANENKDFWEGMFEYNEAQQMQAEPAQHQQPQIPENSNQQLRQVTKALNHAIVAIDELNREELIRFNKKISTSISKISNKRRIDTNPVTPPFYEQ